MNEKLKKIQQHLQKNQNKIKDNQVLQPMESSNDSQTEQLHQEDPPIKLQKIKVSESKPVTKVARSTSCKQSIHTPAFNPAKSRKYIGSLDFGPDYRKIGKHYQPQKYQFHQQQSSMIKKWKYGNGKTNDKTLIVSWNINGIRKAFHNSLVHQYIRNVNADILCLLEVKINQQNYKNKPVTISGYEGYWNFCKCSAGYSGVAVFSKIQPIAVFEDFQQRQFSQQGRVLTLQYEKFYLVVAYIPTAGQKLERLDYKVNKYQRVFYKHCSNLLNHKHVIIAGDLNICHTILDYHLSKTNQSQQSKTPSSTQQQRNNFEKFLNIGFIDTFRRLNAKSKKFSWYNVKRLGRQKNLGKRLDYFLVNDDFINAVKRSDVLSDIVGSDHCPIELNLDLRELTAEDTIKRQKMIKFRCQYIKTYFMLQNKQNKEE